MVVCKVSWSGPVTIIYLIIIKPYSKIGVNFKSIICILRAIILSKPEIRAFGYLENINSIIVFKD